MKLITILRILSAIISLFVSLTVTAQPPQFLVTHRLDARAGLSSPHVRKILQDSYGFYWFATQEGLNRFDGQRFHIFNSGLQNRKLNLQASDVYGIEEDRERKLVYAVTAYGGIDVISTTRNEVVRAIPLRNKKDKSLLWLNGTASTARYLYISSNEGTLTRFNKETEQTDRYINTSEYTGYETSIDHITTDASGRLWVFIAKYGILIFDAELNLLHRVTLGKLALSPSDNAQFFGAIQQDNYMLLATKKGLKAVSVRETEPVPLQKVFNLFPGELDTTQVYGIYSSEKKIMLVAGELVYKYKEGKWQKFYVAPKDRTGEWLSNVTTIFFSGEATLLGTQEGALWSKNINSPFIPYNASQDKEAVNIPHATSLYMENDSILFAGSTTHMFRLNVETGIITNLSTTTNSGAEKRIYFCVFPLDKSNLLVSNDKPEARFINGEGGQYALSSRYPVLKPMENGNLVSCVPFNDSLVFMASQDGKGIYKWDKRRNTLDSINSETTPLSLRSPVINRLYLDQQQKIWIICDDDVSVYDVVKQTITPVSLRNPVTQDPTRINMDIAETKDNYWIASYGTGIIKLNKNREQVKIYTRFNGMHNLSLYKIFTVGDSLVIASSNNGISVLNIKTERIINFFEQDGLMSNNFEETGGYSTNNDVYFGGVNGVTRIIPAKLDYEKKQLAVYFTDIEITLSTGSDMASGDFVPNTFDLTAEYYKIPKGYDKVTVYFTALGALYPDKITFQYRIPEIGKNWISLGNRRFVDLIGIRPGKYHLEIRAMDENGTITPVKTLTLRFLPKWHQTLVFKLGIGLLAFGLIYAFYRYRINQIKKQQKIRKDISTDLHDDIGSTLNSVKIYTHLAQEGNDKDKYIEMAKQNLEQASIGLRDMIWVLDDKLDTADELLTRIKQFALPLANAMQIETDFKCDFEIQSKIFSKEEKRNLLLICKEAINNCVKYSSATSITVHFAQAQKKIKMIISDNGKGFDISHATAGNGLKNMQYRTKQIGYKCSITSEAESGTTVTVWQA